jgi:hypothetical protein
MESNRELKLHLQRNRKEERRILMAIDRADWHWETAEEEFREKNGVTGELTQEQINRVWLYAANHIGLFVKWIIDRGFEGEDADPDLCEKVRAGEMSGTEYLMINCDGKLWESDIREDILPFVMAYYYDESGEYLKHYAECCLDDDDKPCYGVITGEEDYKRLKAIIDDAYAQFLAEKH